jgi:hypothetical protein
MPQVPIKQLAATIFKNDPEVPDAPPVEVTTCDGSARGQRCVVATRPCGASETRIRWIAPSKWRGAIWFSVGFVTTDDASGVPNDFDFVTEVSMPINAAAEGPPYEMTFESGCSVSRIAGSRGAAGAAPFALLLLGMAVRLRRRRAAASSRLRRDSLLLLAVFAVIGGAGCGDDSAPYVGQQESTVSLFTPGDGTYVADAAMVEAMCSSPNLTVTSDEDGGAKPQHPGGTLAISFKTDARPGEYDKAGLRDNNGVVWIEDAAGRHVTTLERWGVRWLLTNLRTYLLTKMRLGCPDPPDIISTATKFSHEVHDLKWNGKNLDGDVVPDGMYYLWIEVQVDEQQPKLPAVTIPFTKDRNTWTLQIPPSGTQTAMTLTYTPSN